MAETITLDPSAVAVNRTQLDITGWIRAAGVDWGDAAITAYMAEQAVGSSAVDYRLPNRTVSIPLTLKDLGATSYATVVTELQQKAALLQREGGWLGRQVDSTPLYADVVNATLHLGGSWLQTYRSADVDAVLTLECVPDWYGDEVTLDTVTASVGKALSVLKLSSVQASVAGGYPGRCRIVVTDTSGNDQKGLIWGLRARYYDSASSAALFYEAESLTPVNGAATATLSGASGGSVVTISSLPNLSWVSMLTTEIVSGSAQLTHRGSYRVWARVYAATGTPQLRLVWGVGSLSAPVTNSTVAIPGAGAFYLVDLGAVRLDAPPVGTDQWFGVVQAYSTPGGESASIDCLYLQPVDDGAGKLTYSSVPPASAVSSSANAGTGTNNSGVGAVDWTNPSGIVNGTNASIGLTSGQVSHYLFAKSFGFAIPGGATVVGVKASVWKFGSAAFVDNSVKLLKAGAVAGSERALASAWPTSWQQIVYGGPTDLWGTTITPTDVNNSGFGVAISAKLPGSGPATSLVGSPLTLTVYYTLAAGFTVAPDAVVFASQTSEIRFDGAYRTAGSSVYGPVSKVIGDLPRLPPSGLEGRPVELLVRPSRGDLNTLADSALDGFTAQVKYRPSYPYKP